MKPALSLPQRMALLPRDVVLLGLCLFFVRATFTASFPLLVAGDGASYFDMMITGESSLLHAPGYPFLMRPLVLLAGLVGASVGETLRLFQPLMALVPVLLLQSGLRRLVPPWWAFAICLVLGTGYLSLSGTATTRPEFLQELGVLLLLALLLHFALTAPRQCRVRLWLSVAAGITFGIGYLIKYNSLAAAPLFLLLLLAPGATWREKLRYQAIAAGLAGIVVAAFVFLIHEPRTGTRHLNLEHGWIHMKKLHAARVPIEPENGPASMRYLILTSVFPKEEEGVGWSRVQGQLSAHRTAMRERYAEVLNSDAATEDLQRWYERAGRPTGNHLKFMLLYYHLGLEEADRLMRNVLWEAVARYPDRYLRHVGQHFWLGLDHVRLYRPYLPVFEAPSPLFPRLIMSGRCPFIPLETSALSSAPLPVESLREPCIEPGTRYFGRRSISTVGAAWLSLFSWPHLIPSVWVWTVCLAAMVVALSRFHLGKATLSDRLTVATIISVLSFIAFASLVFLFREKDVMVIGSMITVVFWLSVARFVKWAWQHVKLLLCGAALRSSESV